MICVYQEKDEKLDGDDAVNKWLHDLCLSGDEKLDGDAALNKFSCSRCRPEGDAMAASDLESEAKEAFDDDTFKLIAEFYTEAIDDGPATANLYAGRAEVHIKLGNYTGKGALFPSPAFLPPPSCCPRRRVRFACSCGVVWMWCGALAGVDVVAMGRNVVGAVLDVEG